MLARVPVRVTRSPRSEQGFTLVEMLVVMVAGMVVVSALFAIFDLTLHQTTRTFSTVDASQRSRIALEQIENELHSACVGSGVTPVQAGSSGTSLIFVSQYGSTASNANAASLTPVAHTITYNSTSGTLTDTTTAATGGAAPNWIFGGSPTTRRLLDNAALPAGQTSMFQYFGYTVPMHGGVAYTDAAGNPYEMLIDGINAVPGTSPAVIPSAAPLSVPLSTADAQNTAEVLINMLVKPSGGSNENTNLGTAPVADQVVLRLTPPGNHAGGGTTFGPCQ